VEIQVVQDVEWRDLRGFSEGEEAVGGVGSEVRMRCWEREDSPVHSRCDDPLPTPAHPGPEKFGGAWQDLFDRSARLGTRG
jgi:hypothetical protein